MEDSFVFEMTASAEDVVETFYAPIEFLPPTELTVSEEQAESEMPVDDVFWTEEALLADPEMIAFYAWCATMQALVAAPTLEEQLAICAPFQAEVFS